MVSIGTSSFSWKKHVFGKKTRIECLPKNHTQVSMKVRQCVGEALLDGHRLLEVEFPPCNLDAVEGDEEGMREANRNVEHARIISTRLSDLLPHGKERMRVLFADRIEHMVATKGSDGFDQVDAIDPTFEGWTGRLGWLTDPSFFTESGIGAWLGMENRVWERLEEEDEMLVMAMPSFSINEMMAVSDAWEMFAKDRDVPVVVINGSLDRIRSGYYPSFWSRKENTYLRETFVPKFETVYYIHNFKGSKPATLYRAYPGPWQVYRKMADGTTTLVHEQESMPSLKEVALDILPRVA